MSYTDPPPPGSGDQYGQGQYGQGGDQYGQGGYGGQPPQYGMPTDQGGAPKSSGKAIASMVTGLVGLLTLCCGFFVASSIAAIVLSFLAKKDIKSSNGQLKGDGMALTGLITGIIGVVMVVISIILVATGAIDTNFEYSTS
ncbi:DUF4190 domain-containing protein [Nocardioides ferulae]|uniref:DUF4190 domain-containing protein n=1 Tax=Nocardioides ferulae TaxID=2340821 RepID=UPI000EAD0D3F|nr:DUF4190 domain-containing protein [Nocardioides ferulae]